MVTLLTVALTLFVSSRQTPIYESEASVLVTPIETGNETIPIEEPNLATEAELVRSATVANLVADDLGVRGRPSALLENLDVAQPAETEILEIHYRDPDPITARAIATGFAEGYLEFRERDASLKVAERSQDLEDEIQALEQRLSDIDRELLQMSPDDPRRPSRENEQALLGDLILRAQVARISLPEEVTGGRIIQPASLPSTPVSPNHIVNGVLGLLGGLALGVGQALIRDRMSGRLRSSEEVEDYLEAPVLAIIPPIPEWRRRKQAYLASLSRRHSPASEAFRILRTNVLSAASATGAKTIVVTSAHSGEGKSSTVANLGLLLARAGKRVTLVSADLRRPRLHEFFRGDERRGLSDVLAGRFSLKEVLQEVSLPFQASMDPSPVTLRLLAGGGVPADPAELLSSAAMADVMRKLEETSDYVLIDVPPMLPVADATVVAPLADSVLLVIGPNSCTRGSVIAARQQLDRARARLLGAVLNGPNAIKTQSYGYY